MVDTCPSSAPFPAANALSKERLDSLHLTGCGPISTSTSPSSSLLNDGSEKSIAYLPGEPTISLAREEVYAFLSQELDTPVLDELHDKLWLVARQCGQSIDPLHRQKIKGRNIIPTEDPKLHLVWQRDKIYVKPIPVCLLNHDFWSSYLSLRVDEACPKISVRQNKRSEVVPGHYHRIVMGFLRSYAFLVQHRLDFILARECHLISDQIDWVQWSRFISSFRHVEDERVAKRYHYGQLRLSRLNWAVRVFRPQTADTLWFYEVPYWSTGEYVRRAFAPLIIAFACLSLVLSSMQVVLAVPAHGQGSGPVDNSGLNAMRQAFWVFSITVMILSSILWLLVIVIPLNVILWQLLWGFRNRKRSTTKDAAVE